MALRFGNTTRLHHIDFPKPCTESGAQTWEQTMPETQHELKQSPQGNPSHKTSKVNVKIRRKHEKENTKKSRQDGIAQPTELKSEILQNSGNCGYSLEAVSNRSPLGSLMTQQSIATCHMNLTVEWDVLDSFSEFATFLELQNPICPAHLIDTPEKLLSVLSYEFYWNSGVTWIFTKLTVVNFRAFSNAHRRTRIETIRRKTCRGSTRLG